MSYFQQHGLSASEIATFIESPVEWYHVYKLRDWQRKPATAAMQLGTDIHKMIEDGSCDAFRSVTIPDEVLNAQGHRKGKAYIDWAAQQEPGVTILKSGEVMPHEIIWEHLNAVDFCCKAVNTAKKEIEIYVHDDEYGPLKGKVDAILEGSTTYLIDWKTCQDASADAFRYEVIRRNYDVRMAHYCRIVEMKFGLQCTPILVAIEKAGSYRVQPYDISDWMGDAEAKLMIAMDDMRRFDLKRHLGNVGVTELVKPKWSEFVLPEVDDAD